MSSMGKRVNNNRKKTAGSAGMEILSYLMEMITAVYLFFMLCIYPLWYKNKYFDIGTAKYEFFSRISYCYIAIMITMLIINIAILLSERKLNAAVRDSDKNAICTSTDWFAAIYLLIAYVSYLFSMYTDTALHGYDGWFMGLLTQMIFILTYFFISRYWKWSPAMLLMGIFAAALVYFLAIIMRFGVDVLGMYKNVRVDDIEKFVSTWGQLTWYSSYAVLLLPIGIYYFCNDDVIWTRAFSGVFICLGSMSIVSVNSDSAYVALPLILLVFGWYAFESNKKFGRYLELCILILGSFLLLGVLKKVTGSFYVFAYDSVVISEFVSGNLLMWLILGVLVLIYTAFRLYEYYVTKNRLKNNFDIKRFKPLRTVLVGLVIVGIWGVVLLIILTTNDKLPSSLEFLKNISFFNFDDYWGNVRGFNWKMAVKGFLSGDMKDRLIGVGPDCFVKAMDVYCKTDVARVWGGMNLACAHNEVLNMLVTVGILGTIAYYGCMISLFVRLGRIAKKEPFAIAIMAVIIAYIGHNFFCYQTCACTPYLFIFMGMGEMMLRKNIREMKTGKG